MADKATRRVRQPARKTLGAVLAGQGILNPGSARTRAYLKSHPDLAAILPAACSEARKEFGEEAELTLDVYRDPEIDDHYLRLAVRLPSYDETIMARIEQVLQPFEAELSNASGYLLVTTDFRPTRAKHVV